MLRKMIVFVLAAVLLMGSALSANSDNFVIVDEYGLQGVLSRYNGPGGRVVVPDGVKYIGTAEPVFMGRSDITSVVIPESVEWIGGSAFANCTGLTEILLPGGVSGIATGAFRDCTGLKKAVLSSRYTKVYEYAFAGCTALEDLTIPAGVGAIGEYAFADCSSLQRVEIPNTVMELGQCAFINCANLRDVILPTSLPTIEVGTFENCSSLSNVLIPESVKEIREYAFAGCSGLQQLTLPNSITEIEANAFTGCSGLTDIVIPSTVSSIRGDIFDRKDTDAALTIHGAAGSLAEGYAQSRGFYFVADQNFAAPNTPVSEVATAYPSTQTVEFFGVPTQFQMYALKDQNGNMTNYIKLRDLAYCVANYSAPSSLDSWEASSMKIRVNLKGFNVKWDGGIVIETGLLAQYEPNGTEMTTPFSGARSCQHGPSEVRFIERLYDKGDIKSLDSLLLQDDAGNGYTYFKLRDLGDLLGIKVDWSAERGVFLE